MMQINREACVGCGECVTACMFNAIDMENGTPVFTDACVACGNCANSCPAGAILQEKANDLPDELKKHSGIWVVLEVDRSGKQLRKVSLELLSEARKLADRLHQRTGAVLLCKDMPQKLEQQLEQVGCQDLYIVQHNDLENYQTDRYCGLICQLVDKYKPAAILFPATENGRDLAPRVSCKLQVGLTADCTALDIDADENLVQIRPTFGGNIMASIISPRHRPQLASVRPNVLLVCESEKRYPLNKIHESLIPDCGMSTAVLQKITEKTSVYKDVSEANIVIVAGYGVGSLENYKKIEKLAIKMNAAIGATRKVVDEGWAPPEIQVGQTGKTIAPDIYIACGVSGALQHSIGIKNAKYKIAINSDPAAPIFSMADVAILGDCVDVAEEMYKRIAEQ